MTYTAEERRSAAMLGELRQAQDGSYAGHLIGIGGDTLLLTARLDEGGKLLLLARHGSTPDQKRLRREHGK